MNLKDEMESAVPLLYPYPKSVGDYRFYSDWLEKNNIRHIYRENSPYLIADIIYFKNEEDLTAFKLTFGF